jgi:hypothetical protein
MVRITESPITRTIRTKLTTCGIVYKVDMGQQAVVARTGFDKEREVNKQ